ncbi:hypothetical protein MTBPR1_200024 [Candidatus Terasakiella magnetica]|uniref:Uncharacterized protein n=1 Tax=Candidatus Terasakiella magnetica TaxID=1867952 RepID=A0A1C3RH86_9PROT|nr:hypothetical protein [Candidatus Terasakiella magnetica]SCA56544.1 hypothetical protein MTBPR1_200024 [Candidatus Terasakiella magnetica]
MVKILTVEAIDYEAERFIPETWDTDADKYTDVLKSMAHRLLSIIYFNSNEDMKPFNLGLSDGVVHTFKEQYDFNGEIKKRKFEDSESQAEYEDGFKEGFKNGILLHYNVDCFMKHGLNKRNYHPIVIDYEGTK